MKQRFSCIKVSIGGLLLLCLFLVMPVAESANAYSFSTSLSSLEQIEPLISDGPEVLAALAALARDEALEAVQRQRAGAKYFWGLTYGDNKEPDDSDTIKMKNLRFIDDTGDSISLPGTLQAETTTLGARRRSGTSSFGLTFPLLGTRQKEKIGNLEAETTTLETRYRSQMLSLHNLVAIRKAYAALWIEQQKEEVARRFLATEAETAHILQERQTQGLVLPVDRLEFLAVYQEVKRDMTASKLRQAQALNMLNLATGQAWVITQPLKAPSLPMGGIADIELAVHPEAVFYRKRIEQYEKIFTETKEMKREANLTIGGSVSKEFSGSAGNGVYIAFAMTEPVKSIRAKDQAKLAAAEELSRAKQEETFIRLRLEGQLREALGANAYAADDVNARAARLIVMTEAIREKMLRRLVLPGDTFEQLQHSKSQYYRAALEMLEREDLFLQSAIDIVSYVYPQGLASERAQRVSPIQENDAVRQNLLAPNWLTSGKAAAASKPLDFSVMPTLTFPVRPFGANEKTAIDVAIEKRQAMPLQKIKAAIYVWDAEPFLQSDTRTVALNEIVNAGFSRMLISFTHKQVLNLLAPKGKKELDALLVAAKSQGVRIDLMLGDPAWAEPDHRGKLLSLIEELRTFDFDGIHLDIEPDSLPGAAVRRAELLAGLADTLKAVKAITILPVSISIHPRYLEGDLGVLARQKLLTLELEEVVVMIYSDNPRSTAQRMAAIIRANSGIPLSLAQSVEKNIPAAESYADNTPQEFKASMHVLEDELAVHGLKGIYIQAWEDYRKREMQ